MFHSDGGEQKKNSAGRNSLFSPSPLKNEKKTKLQAHVKGSSEKPAIKSFKSTRKKENRREAGTNLGSDPVPADHSSIKKVPSNTLGTRQKSLGKIEDDETDAGVVRSLEPVGSAPEKEVLLSSAESAAVVVRETRASRLRAASKVLSPEPNQPSRKLSSGNRKSSRQNGSLFVELVNNKSLNRKSHLNKSGTFSEIDGHDFTHGNPRGGRRSLRHQNLESCSSQNPDKKDGSVFTKKNFSRTGKTSTGIRQKEPPLTRKFSIAGQEKSRLEVAKPETENRVNDDSPGMAVDRKSVAQRRNLKGNSYLVEEVDFQVEDESIHKKSGGGCALKLVNRLAEMSSGEARKPVEKLEKINMDESGLPSDFNAADSEIRRTEGKKLPSGPEINYIPEMDSSKPSVLKSRLAGDPQKPISILKRKCFSQKIGEIQGSSPVFPVTFSPSALKKENASRKKQGILKKRRSLDENEVRRERSTSPDAKPILKNQRRCSMEELTRRTQSPDSGVPHGILKRKCSKEEVSEEEPSAVTGEPQGILKRKFSQVVTGAQQLKIHEVPAVAPSEGPPDLQIPENVRPILKKKMISEEYSFSDVSLSEIPKSILKKKTSLENEEVEDKPMKPILKTSKTSSADEPEDGSLNSEAIKPILKKEPVGRAGESEEGDFPSSCLKSGRHSFPDVEGPSRTLKSKRRSLDSQSAGFESFSDRKSEKMKRSSSNEVLANRSKGSASPDESHDFGEASSLPVSHSGSSISEPEGVKDGAARSSLMALMASSAPSIRESLAAENISFPGDIIPPEFSGSPDTRECRPSAGCEKSGGEKENAKMNRKVSVESCREKILGLTLEESAGSDVTAAVDMDAGKSGDSESFPKEKRKDESEKAGPRENNGFFRRRSKKESGSGGWKRFNTQPLSFDQIQWAVRKREEEAAAAAAAAAATANPISSGLPAFPVSGRDEGDHEDEASTMSYSERVRLFEFALTPQFSNAAASAGKSRCTRYSTQPVTAVEVQTARDLNQNKSKIKNAQHSVSAKDQVFKPKNRINQSKSPIALELEAILNTSKADSSSNGSRKREKNLSLKGDSESVEEVRPSDKDGVVSRPPGERPPKKDRRPLPAFGTETASCLKDESRSAVQRRINESRNNSSSIVKSQSHSGVSSAFRPSHEKSLSKNPEGSSGGSVESERRKEGEGGSCVPRPFRSSSDSSVDDDMSGASIQERLARLKKNGESGWQKRKCHVTSVEGELSVLSAAGAASLFKQENKGFSGDANSGKEPRPAEEQQSKSSSLADRLNRLDAAQSGWKKRVQPSDAVRFSVEGKMTSRNAGEFIFSGAKSIRPKQSPKPVKFRSRDLDLSSSAAEKSKNISSSKNSENPVDSKVINESVISVPKNDDETFTSFFNGISGPRMIQERLEIKDEDLDVVTFMKSSQLLVQKKNIKMQKRKPTVRNPVKSLASRLESQVYTEIKTGLPQRETRRMNLEKGEKGSHLAIEALAGLASHEDFTAINLKKASEGIAAFPDAPYKDLMLLHVKGRRHVQTRLVEPVAASLNSGDCFVLVTRNKVFHYVGRFSNVIERSRASEISSHIQQKGDLGCGAESVITIGETGRATSDQIREFWTLLGGKPGCERGAGTPDEDEIFESCLVDTNMVYEVINDELVPNESFWGSTPKYEILDPNKVLIFDFGSEFYVWNGKGVSVAKRKMALKLGKELWEEGFDYSDCALCPITAASCAGSSLEEIPESLKAGASRPPWTLFAKITQNMETVLFREKFLDWPDYSRVIRKNKKGGEEESEENEGQGDETPYADLKACDPAAMAENVVAVPDLVLEGSHLGRGIKYFDEETRRFLEITTRDVKVWHINEYEYSEVPESSLGQFHMEDSYVVRWYYTVTVVGRELSGQPSKHLTTGRDRYAYFCWQGQDSPISDKGAAACITVELDKENGPQVRVPQGFEPPAFLNLFRGKMVVHRGKRSCSGSSDVWRLFISRGETESESVLFEVACSMGSLRSAASFVLINRITGILIVWHGTKSSETQKKVAVGAAKGILSGKPKEFHFEPAEVSFFEETEGSESSAFLNAFGAENRTLYCSLLGKDAYQISTPRLFCLSSISGDFDWTEVASPYLGEEGPTPFPFLQADLYSSSQPALFLLDSGSEVWLWQGWLEEEEDGDRGGGKLRFQAERRAAMATAIAYCGHGRGGRGSARSPDGVHLIWAGLEPLTFINQFPFWTDRVDVAEINMKDGRKPGEMVSAVSELDRLTRSFYSPSELKNRPLPEGVNPNFLEDYLKPQYFQELFGLEKEEFYKMPSWKKKKFKKEAGLF